MRKRTRTQSSAGSMCTSEARSRSAWVTILLTTWTIGACGSTTSSMACRSARATISLRLERLDVGADRRQRAVGLVDAVAQLRRHAERECTSSTGSERSSAMTSTSSGSATATVSAPSANTNGSTSWRCASGDSTSAVASASRRRVAQVDDRDVQLLAQRSRDVVFAEQPQRDEALPEPPGQAAVRGVLDRLAADDAAVDQDVADSEGAFRRTADRELGVQPRNRRPRLVHDAASLCCPGLRLRVRAASLECHCTPCSCWNATAAVGRNTVEGSHVQQPPPRWLPPHPQMLSNPYPLRMAETDGNS